MQHNNDIPYLQRLGIRFVHLQQCQLLQQFDKMIYDGFFVKG